MADPVNEAQQLQKLDPDKHCDKCTNKLGNNWVVQCSVCDMWLHRTCTDLDLEFVKLMNKLKTKAWSIPGHA